MSASIDIKIAPENILEWSSMEDWENGASAAPTEHVLSGSGASVARESTNIHSGEFSAAVTRSGADTTLYHDVEDYAQFKSRRMTFGCWVQASVASRGRIAISDGVGSSESSYHTGGGSFEFLSVTRDIDSSATRVRVEMQVNTGNTTVYFDEGILCHGEQTFVTLNNIADVGQWTISNRFRADEYAIIRSPGSVMPSSIIESKSIRISGMVVSENIETARTNYDAVLKILANTYVKSDDTEQKRILYLLNDRFIRGRVSAIESQIRASLRVREYDLTFIASDPFEYYINKKRISQTISATPTTFNVDVSGNYRVYPQIMITNNSSNASTIVLENLTSGSSFTYTGTIVTSQSLFFDAEKLSVENNGVSDLGNAAGDVDFFLLPGRNVIKLTGVVSGDINVDFFNRWV
jgi:hypothetical protein